MLDTLFYKNIKYIDFIRYLILFVFSSYPSISYSADFFAHSSQQALFNHDQNKTVIAAVPEFFPPFYYTSPENQPYGMAIEVLNEIDHDAGFLAQYTIKKNWGEVLKAIDNNEAQIIPNLGITEERKKKFFFTAPYAKIDITLFSRVNSAVNNLEAATNLPVGVVKNNIGVKIAKKYKLKNIHTYNTLKLAYAALLNNKIDFIIFPKLTGIKSAKEYEIFHKINYNKTALLSIQRAIAVSKKHPELFKRINTALNNYLNTQDYKDTYIAWYGQESNILTISNLVFLNIFILIFSIAFFNFFWRKKKDNPKTVWAITLIAILIAITSIVTFSTLWILYLTSFQEQRVRLVDTVKSRARLIEAIARYELNENKALANKKPSAHKNIISQVIDAHKNFRGFGQTGEFTLAYKENNKIEFILRQRHSNLIIPKSVPINSKLAAAMRLALLGHSGTIIGPDYRGEQVLAAYEPISILNFGVVAKIDIKEIRTPFIHSALIVSALSIIVSLIGSLLFFYIITPVINKIKETEQRFHQIFLNNYTPVLLVDSVSAKIIDANNAAIKYYKYSIKELNDYKLNDLCFNQKANAFENFKKMEFDNTKPFITQHRLHNGEVRDVEILMSPVKLNQQEVIYCTIIDITDKLKKEQERTRLEKDLEQARKMEALGQLTGGIAHDFNNMLGIIMGYTELSLEKTKNDASSKIPEYLKNVMTASNRAKELISSMMLFSRTDGGKYQTMNISPLVKEDIKMLRSIIPSSIEIKSYIDETLPAVLIEPVKLQQLLMNLCVNARDAMDNKGLLTVELNLHEDVSNNCLICHQHIKGDWINLSVSDNGSGMTDAIKSHIFEPFFTTKAQNKGTGMGMAVVHGIVQDLNGHIFIDSELGKGTTIHILLNPVYNKYKLTEDSHPQPKQLENKHEHILVVDDEEHISKLTKEILLAAGYQCTNFTSSIDALNEFSQYPKKYNLIISDQTMPELTGLEMIKRMQKIRSDIPVIIATGYSESIDTNIATENNIQLLNKPVPRDKLLKTISERLQKK